MGPDEALQCQIYTFIIPFSSSHSPRKTEQMHCWEIQPIFCPWGLLVWRYWMNSNGIIACKIPSVGEQDVDSLDLRNGTDRAEALECLRFIGEKLYCGTLNHQYLFIIWFLGTSSPENVCLFSFSRLLCRHCPKYFLINNDFVFQRKLATWLCYELELWSTGPRKKTLL